MEYSCQWNAALVHSILVELWGVEGRHGIGQWVD